MSLEQDLNKLQGMFEGNDSEQQEQVKAWIGELKTARLKENFRGHPVVKMILAHLQDKIELCKNILLTDRGDNRDPVMDKIYKTKVYQQLDDMEWFVGLFGSDDELKELKRTLKREVKANKEFIEE